MDKANNLLQNGLKYVDNNLLQQDQIWQKELMKISILVAKVIVKIGIFVWGLPLAPPFAIAIILPSAYFYLGLLIAKGATKAADYLH